MWPSWDTSTPCPSRTAPWPESIAALDDEQIGSPNLVVKSPLALGTKVALGFTDEQYAAMVLAANAPPKGLLG